MKPKKRLLLVDDNADILNLYAQILGRHGYEILQASTGQEGLDLVRCHRPDLVLLDVVLPDLSGTEICEIIKSDPSLNDTFVVLVSGEACSPRSQVTGFVAGADDYICKAGDPDEFLARIDRMVRLQDAAANLREREQLNRSILQAAMDGFRRCDLEGRILDANEAYCRMTGYTVEELRTMHIKDLEESVPTQEQVAQDLARIVQKGSDRFEARQRAKTGRFFDVEMSAAYLKAQGEHLFAFIRDISERKRAEAALQASEARYRSLIENSPAISVILKQGGVVDYANPTCFATTGYAPKDLIGHNAFDFVSPDDLPEVKERWLRLATEPLHATCSFTMRLRHADGTWHVHEGIATNLLPDPAVAGILVNTHDITRQQQAQEVLEQLPRRILEAQETERKRVACELHDGVNQLLIATKFQLQVVQPTIARLDDEIGKTVADCCEVFAHALEEIRRIAQNLRPIHLEELGLGATCDKWCKEFQERTGILVRSQALGFTQRLRPDAELHLFRIVQEALNNVEKHARAQHVTVRLETLDSIFTLEVHDDGCGFAPDSPSETARQRQGLGLTNLHKRALSLGGSCEVTSTLGRGTVIRLKVPLPQLLP